MRAHDVLAVRHLHRQDHEVGSHPRVRAEAVDHEGAIGEHVAGAAADEYKEREPRAW